MSYDDSDIDAGMARRMFQAIVAQAAEDAVAPDNDAYSKTPPIRRTGGKKGNPETDEEYEERTALVLANRFSNAQRQRTDARYWLLHDMENFPLIATMAGYNPIDVRERARKLEKAGWPSRTEQKLSALAA